MIEQADVIICIPTKRPPPVLTLEAYHSDLFKTLIIADPSVFPAHFDYYEKQEQFEHNRVSVTLGAEGMGAQCEQCYLAAQRAGFPWYFRMDDDLPELTFLEKYGYYPTVDEVIQHCIQAANETRTTLVGLANTSNTHWLGEGYCRTWGIIHGGAHLCKSDPVLVDPALARCTDTYMSCAHRAHDGAVGRVKFIGIDKSKSTTVTGNTVVKVTAEQVEEAHRIILERFPGMVSFNPLKFHRKGFVR